MTNELRNLANKLQMMWGRHPDVDLIREAADKLEKYEAEECQRNSNTAKTSSNQAKTQKKAT